MPWVSPTSSPISGAWFALHNARDNNLSSYAITFGSYAWGVWTDWAYLYIDPTPCTAIRHYFVESSWWMFYSADVFYSGAWHSIVASGYNSVNSWVVSQIGSEELVTGMRLKFLHIDFMGTHYAELAETDFFRVASARKLVNGSVASKSPLLGGLA